MSRKRPRVLIEEWLPIEALGIESNRENSTGQHPPLNRLHVWWARRPLTASRAAVLASLLPAYSDEWPKKLKDRFPSHKDYHNWFLRFIGILGDPVAARKLLNFARDRDIKVSNPYGYSRAFKSNPDENDIEMMKTLLINTWKDLNLSVLDPMAGGGSIPFEALRYGFNIHANELNPVASVILDATFKYPILFGKDLIPQIKNFSKEISTRARKLLSKYFPSQKNEQILCYLWARTVNCPSSGKPIPLSPNWWLRKGSKPIAVNMMCETKWKKCKFEIIKGKAVTKYNPDEGTINRGTAISPWSKDTIDASYIKAEAKAGRALYL